MKLRILIFTVLFLTFTSATAFGEMFLFVSNGCGYCTELREYLNKNDLYTLNDISEYEVFSSEENADLFLEKSKEVRYSSGALPVLIDGENYYVGKSGIIDYLSANAEETAEPTYISNEDSNALNGILSEDPQPAEPDSKTKTIGIITILFGLTFFTTIMYRAGRKR